MINKDIFITEGSALRELLMEPALKGDFNRRAFNQYLVVFARIVLAAVFIYAAVGKIDKPLMFAEQIRNYKMLDISPLLYIIAIVLPWIELLCGISLITGIFIRGASLTLTAMNLGFLIVIVYKTLYEMDSTNIAFFDVFFDCGCGFKPTHAWKKILEDVGLLGLSLLLLFSREHRFILLRLRK
jgi:uncharacterized membrane protein YphA (DoxX/SURF4 family)